MSRNLPPRQDKNRVPRQKRELPAAPMKEAERVAKVVARAGLASRREIEEWIAQGRIAVNGVVLTSPAVTVTAKDVITVDGAPLPERERTRLFLYHKPRGVVTTNRDPEGRTTLFELLPRDLPRLVSVGRLDLNSEGLLLLTNDGGLSRVLELPETGWLRRYRVRAHGDIDQAQLDTLMKGISVNGVDYGPIEAELERVQGSNAWITVSLREGKNREVRNVLGALGLVVNRLIRISYGPFQLGDLPEGDIEEVRTRVLRDQLGEDLASAAGADFAGPLVEREPEEAPRRLLTHPGANRTDPPRSGGSSFSGPRQRRRISDTGELESRGTVADRKGRTVTVERVVSGQDDPFRSMDRPTRAGADATVRGSRPGSRFSGHEDGPRRGPARFGEDRPGSKRGFEGPRANRPASRPAYEDFRRGRSHDDDGSERKRGPRGFGERPRHGGYGDAQGKGRFETRPRDDRPREDRFREDRPRKSGFAGPRGYRPEGERDDRFANPPRRGFERPRTEDGGSGNRTSAGRGMGGKSFGSGRFKDSDARTRHDGADRFGAERSEGRTVSDRSFSGKGRTERPEGRSFGKGPGRTEGGRAGGAGRSENPGARSRHAGGDRFGAERSEGRAFSDRPFSGKGRTERPEGRSFGKGPGRPAGGAGKGFGSRPGSPKDGGFRGSDGRGHKGPGSEGPGGKPPRGGRSGGPHRKS